MTRLYVATVTRPRLMLLGAAFLNLIHPLIHGTPLDSGALDATILAADAAALSTR